MNNSVHLGDGVLDETKAEINNRITELIKIVIDVVFNSLKDKIDDLPAIIEQLRNNPEVEQKIATLWSKHLAEKGLIPKGYNGLPDHLLISNFLQDGYLEGLYVGYVLAMMALVDNNASKNIIIAVRDYIRPNLTRHYYHDRDEFINRYKNEQYRWIDKVK